MRFSDNSIAIIAKTLQMAILTGTDIVENLRLIRFESKGGSLEPEEEFTKEFEAGIQRMLEVASELESN
jgi:hypothetical protein